MMLKHISYSLAPKIKTLGGDKKHRLLITHWQDFVGADYSASCQLDKITFFKKQSQRCLTILADRSCATELEYLTNDILTRINAFLGEDYITQIRIKQGFIESVTPQSETY